MPSATFKHLPATKQARIRAALLKEFSQYPLAHAQVARIVATAGIARGAFYKYFTDLTDAYLYLYHWLMEEIHTTDEEHANPQTPSQYVARVQHLVQATSDNHAFFKLHYTANEGLLPHPAPLPADISATNWAVMELSHATIKACLMAPAAQAVALTRLKTALTALLGGE